MAGTDVSTPRNHQHNFTSFVHWPRELHLVGSNAILDLSPLACCKFLTHLHLSCCTAVTDLRPLAACCDLQSLTLSECTMLTDVSPLAACPSLKYLNVENYSKPVNPDHLTLLQTARPQMVVRTYRW